jgi:ubiquinone/menaquinone biosynthesis C-methylase UbiE
LAEFTGAEFTGAEFTGERVIPGQVNDDLWSEHLARYAFARRFAEGRRVLDAGSGTGYGAAELSQSAASVVGLEIDHDAVEYSRSNYPLQNLSFEVGSCMAIPFAAQSFELIVAFEVIEHLADYRRFVDECARILTPQGLFIVSSPNRTYYESTRAQTGPNPFHVHEFEPEEFHRELSRCFPQVQLLLQNRVESFAFHPANTFWPADARIDGGGGNATDAHFLIGICAFGALPNLRSFVYVPKAANLLREREQHVQLLEDQLALNKKWFAEAQAERDSLLDLYRKQKEELEAHNRWGEKLSGELETANQYVLRLQQELAAEQQAANIVAANYEAKVKELDAENLAKTEWALSTDARLSKELDNKSRELAECLRLLSLAEATVEERTLWAQRTEAQREELAAQLNLIRRSRWLKLGRKLGLGPVIDR